MTKRLNPSGIVDARIDPEWTGYAADAVNRAFANLDARLAALESANAPEPEPEKAQESTGYELDEDLLNRYLNAALIIHRGYYSAATEKMWFDARDKRREEILRRMGEGR